MRNLEECMKKLNKDRIELERYKRENENKYYYRRPPDVRRDESLDEEKEEVENWVDDETLPKIKQAEENVQQQKHDVKIESMSNIGKLNPEDENKFSDAKLITKDDNKHATVPDKEKSQLADYKMTNPTTDSKNIKNIDKKYDSEQKQDDTTKPRQEKQERHEVNDSRHPNEKHSYKRKREDTDYHRHKDHYSHKNDRYKDDRHKDDRYKHDHYKRSKDKHHYRKRDQKYDEKSSRKPPHHRYNH